MQITSELIKKVEGTELVTTGDLNLIAGVLKAKSKKIDETLKDEIDKLTKQFNEAKKQAEAKVVSKYVNEAIKYLEIEKVEPKEKPKVVPVVEVKPFNNYGNYNS